MIRIARAIFEETQFTTFHIFSIAFFVLSTFIVYTANELGAFAPLLIAVGIYIGIFAIVLEVIYWGRKAMITLIKKIEK